MDITYDGTEENKLYAVSYGNHIVVSYDNGGSWDIFYSTPPSFADGIVLPSSIKDMKLTDNNTALSFIINMNGTPFTRLVSLEIKSGDIIREIYMPNSSDYPWVTSYSMYEGNEDIILIDTNWKFGLANLGKTFYTDNGGSTWREVYYTEDNYNIFINKVAINPANPQKLFLARGNGNTDIDGGLLISDDGGLTWTEKLAGNTLGPIAFNPSNPDDILVGTDISFGATPENLYRSLDNGETWNAEPLTWLPGLLDNIISIHFNPTNPDNIIVLEENEIYISNNNGTTWDNYQYDPYGDDTYSYYYGLSASFNPFNGDEVFITANYYPFFSTDGGVTLTQSRNPFFVSTGNVRYFSNGTKEYLYYGVQYGYVCRDMDTQDETTFGILPLNIFGLSLGSALYLDGVIQDRVYTFSGGFMGSNLYLSDDNGVTKRQVFQTFSKFGALAIYPDNRDIILVATYNTYDGGTSYEAQLTKIDFSNIDNPDQTEITLPGADIINGLHIFSGNTNHIMVAIGAQIYLSTDGGSTWVLKDTGLGILDPSTDLILKLVDNPLNPQQLSITTNKGIFTSLDGGNTWERIYDSLVHNIAHSTKTDGHIVAAVHSTQYSAFGVIYSVDGGNSWEAVSPKDLKYIGSASTDFSFSDKSAEVYIGTSDLGLVKYAVKFVIHDITVSSGNGGTIDPAGPVVSVPDGEDIIFTIIPDEGYVIDDVEVDGISVGNVSSYTFTNLTSNRTISATFRLDVSGIDATGILRTGVYPNPTTGMLTIGNGSNTITSIQILDTTGKVLRTFENVNAQQTVIDISSFAEGIYFIKIDGAVRKVVKK